MQDESKWLLSYVMLCRNKAVVGCLPHQNVLQAAIPSAKDLFVPGSSVLVASSDGYTAAEVGQLGHACQEK